MRVRLVLLLLLTFVACGEPDGGDAGAPDGTTFDDADLRDGFAQSDVVPSSDASSSDASSNDGSSNDDAAPADAGDDAPVEACSTRIHYGSAWIAPEGHPQRFDDAGGVIGWDGRCVNEGANSYAELSNGWRPYFRGRDACVIGLVQRGACPSPAGSCETRVTYGDAWLHPADHPAQHDDVAGVVGWNSRCQNVGGQSRATLSNGWQPTFGGTGRCGFSFRYRQCGALYSNPVIAMDCPDPGVTQDGSRYVLTCTGGRFRIFTSPNLVRWTSAGTVFAAGEQPSWATDSFWAPEIHQVGPSRWVTYFSARHRDGDLAVGAAIADNALGPYTDLGAPLVRDASPGVIDAHYFRASSGERYLLWKLDGNAIARPTPIRIQRLADDGVTRMGPVRDLITNDRGWENHVVEAPWIVERGGMFYLFYSANAYDRPAYAVGVARASSPMGPYTKAANPILTSAGLWDGPGHGSVLVGPSGDWVHVYHGWPAGQAGRNPPGRRVLVDRLDWSGGWPRMLGAPSVTSLPRP